MRANYVRIAADAAGACGEHGPGVALDPLPDASARFPIHRDLAGFDFDQSKVDPRQITIFATTAFTEKAENIVLIGGASKTHLATSLRIDAIARHGKRVRFYSTVGLVNALEPEKAAARAAVWAVCEILYKRGFGHLYVAGGSVFPTSGCANPTRTISALSLRLAEHLHAQALPTDRCSDRRRLTLRAAVEDGAGNATRASTAGVTSLPASAVGTVCCQPPPAAGTNRRRAAASSARGQQDSRAGRQRYVRAACGQESGTPPRRA